MFNCIERKLYVFILFPILLFYNFMLQSNSLIILRGVFRVVSLFCPNQCQKLNYLLFELKLKVFVRDIFCFVKAVKSYFRQNTGTFNKFLRRVAQYEPPPPNTIRVRIEKLFSSSYLIRYKNSTRISLLCIYRELGTVKILFYFFCFPFKQIGFAFKFPYSDTTARINQNISSVIQFGFWIRIQFDRYLVPDPDKILISYGS